MAQSAYALLYSFDTVKMTIFQPRLKNISEAEISVEDLRRWAQEEVKPVALLADKGEGEFNPGPHCKFCRAKAECKARAEACMELAPVAEEWKEKSKGTVKAAGLYSIEDLAEYLKAGALLKDWYADNNGTRFEFVPERRRSARLQSRKRAQQRELLTLMPPLKS